MSERAWRQHDRLDHDASAADTPGRRTLTERLPMVQAKVVRPRAAAVCAAVQARPEKLTQLISSTVKYGTVAEAAYALELVAPVIAQHRPPPGLPPRRDQTRRDDPHREEKDPQGEGEEGKEKDDDGEAPGARWTDGALVQALGELT